VNFFYNFWLQRTFHEWIATKWLEIDQDDLRMKFSVLNADFSSPSVNHLSLWTPAQMNVKKGYPLKVVILPVLARLAWKQLKIGTDYSTPRPVSTAMGDCLRAGKPFRCEACQLGRLNLLPSVGR